MTLSEFRAWLDGFKEAIGDAPTTEQWAKVLEKLAQVNDPAPVIVPQIPHSHWMLPASVWCGPAQSRANIDSGTAAAINGHYAGPSD